MASSFVPTACKVTVHNRQPWKDSAVTHCTSNHQQSPIEPLEKDYECTLPLGWRLIGTQGSKQQPQKTWVKRVLQLVTESAVEVPVAHLKCYFDDISGLVTIVKPVSSFFTARLIRVGYQGY